MSCMQRALPCRGAAALRVPAAHALYAPDRRAAALKRDRPAAACHAWTTGDRCYAVDAKSPRRLLAAATWSIPADGKYSCGFLAAASHAILSRHAAISYLRALQLLLISSRVSTIGMLSPILNCLPPCDQIVSTLPTMSKDGLAQAACE